MTLAVISKSDTNSKSDTDVSAQKKSGHKSYYINKVYVYANKLVIKSID